MKVQVLYFASLREALGLAEEEVELDQDADLAGLLALLRSRGDEWDKLLDPEGTARFAVDHEFAGLDARLAEGCEVGIFPPVTGG